MTLECVLFDLDGTLIDTAPDFIQVLNQLLQDQQKHTLAADVIRPVVSGGARQMVQLGFGGQSGEPDFDRHLQAFLTRYGECLTPQNCQAILFTGLAELLKHLKAQNIPWGIVTNKPERFSRPLMDVLQLNPAVLICPDHVTHTKPDPEPLLLACQQLDCDPQKTVYVGDHQRDIEAGLRANMTTIIAEWGYFDEHEEIEHWNAHHLATSAQHLQQLLMAI